MLTAADHRRIAEAITQAESKCSGDISRLAHEVSRYREVPLLWASVAALAGPPLLVLAGLAAWRWPIFSQAGAMTASGWWKA